MEVKISVVLLCAFVKLGKSSGIFYPLWGFAAGSRSFGVYRNTRYRCARIVISWGIGVYVRTLCVLVKVNRAVHKSGRVSHVVCRSLMVFADYPVCAVCSVYRRWYWVNIVFCFVRESDWTKRACNISCGFISHIDIISAATRVAVGVNQRISAVSYAVFGFVGRFWAEINADIFNKLSAGRVIILILISFFIRYRFRRQADRG